MEQHYFFQFAKATNILFVYDCHPRERENEACASRVKTFRRRRRRRRRKKEPTQGSATSLSHHHHQNRSLWRDATLLFYAPPSSRHWLIRPRSIAPLCIRAHTLLVMIKNIHNCDDEFRSSLHFFVFLLYFKI